MTDSGRGRSARTIRRGHTLVEVLVATAVAGVALGALCVVRFSPPRSVSEASLFGAKQTIDLQGELRKMVVEIQEATRVFYPLPGKGSHDGLGLVNVKGETILYYVERASEKGGLGQIVRVNANLWRSGRGSRATIIDRVSRFDVSVAGAEPGKEASLVNLDVAIDVGDPATGTSQIMNYVTAAFLRNLERNIPDDLFPAGTPLLEVP